MLTGNEMEVDSRWIYNSFINGCTRANSCNSFCEEINVKKVGIYIRCKAIVPIRGLNLSRE